MRSNSCMDCSITSKRISPNLLHGNRDEYICSENQMKLRGQALTDIKWDVKKLVDSKNNSSYNEVIGENCFLHPCCVEDLCRECCNCQTTSCVTPIKTKEDTSACIYQNCVACSDHQNMRVANIYHGKTQCKTSKNSTRYQCLCHMGNISFPDPRKHKLIFGDAPLPHRTMYRTDYRGLDQERPDAIRRTDNLMLPDAPFDNCTSYRLDFHGRELDRPDPVRIPDNLSTADAPFDGCTMYRTDYRGLDQERPDAIRRTDNLMLPDAPFECSTTYRVDFCGNSGVRFGHIKMPDTLSFECVPFGGRSTYSSDFCAPFLSCCSKKSSSPHVFPSGCLNSSARAGLPLSRLCGPTTETRCSGAALPATFACPPCSSDPIGSAAASQPTSAKRTTHHESCVSDKLRHLASETSNQIFPSNPLSCALRCAPVC